jgi:hypothetical protein
MHGRPKVCAMFLQWVLLATVTGTCKTAEKFFELAGASLPQFLYFLWGKMAGAPRVFFALRNLKVANKLTKRKEQRGETEIETRQYSW